jgi:hypothetical protein
MVGLIPVEHLQWRLRHAPSFADRVSRRGYRDLTMPHGSKAAMGTTRIVIMIETRMGERRGL